MDSGGGWHRNNRGNRGGFRGWGNFQRGGGAPWRGGGFNKFRGNSGFRGRNDHGRNQNWRNGPRRDTPGKRLSEIDIAVTEYVTKNEGFNGVIKSRYSDFQVSEINEAGEVAKLTNLEPPFLSVEEKEVDDDNLILNKYNLELLPTETWDRINKLVVTTEETSETVDIDVTGMEKQERCKIHESVKKAFGEAIVGSTVAVEDKKFIRFEKYRKGVRIDSRVKWVWGGEYCHFLLHKENCDTMEAVARLADRLSMKASNLGYAGTKDRRAKSTQWVSARRTEPRRLAAAAAALRDVRLGDYTFSDRCIKLGMLRGNLFRIALRNVTAEDSVVSAGCQALNDHGFINYYGLQRFGTRIEVPTYEIGLKLLKGQFKEAIDDILEDREGVLQEAVQHFKQTRDAQAATRLMPRHCRNQAVEGRLITALARDPKDFVGALDKIPRNTRLLYVHAYQSITWNRCVSARVARRGLRPAVGDLVSADPAVEVVDVVDEESDSEENEENKDKTDQDELDEDAQKLEKIEKEPKAAETKEQSKKARIQVKELTEEDISSGKYSMFDVLLPLPGYDVQYPSNLRDFYEELLTKDGLTMELRNRVKTYSMSGAYRHVLARPGALAWSTARYDDPCADLILSDLDEINKKTLDGVVPDGKYKALILTMSLPASCYATMALRELLKIDTSGDFQASQNNYHKEDRKRPLTTSETEAKRVKTDEVVDKSGKGEDKSGKGEDKSGEDKDVSSSSTSEVKKMAVDE